MAIGSAALVAGWLGIASSSLVGGNLTTEAAVPTQELEQINSQLAAAPAAQADVLKARQAMLTALATGNADVQGMAAQMPRKAPQRATPPLAAPLAQVETRQLALMDQFTGLAQAQLKKAQGLLRKLGLDPSRFAEPQAPTAAGGPFVPAAEGLEPRLRELVTSWRNMETLKASLASIPSMVPIAHYRESSGFGRRYDPFNRRKAMHAGMDMAAPRGEPILAAADGVVKTAGTMSGYGVMAALDHGRGIETRYAHMSRLLVKPGEQVRQGQVIGQVGSTGRSTGNHLHFEVRLDGKPVNPEPFLEAAATVRAASAPALLAAPAVDADGR